MSDFVAQVAAQLAKDRSGYPPTIDLDCGVELIEDELGELQSDVAELIDAQDEDTFVESRKSAIHNCVQIAARCQRLVEDVLLSMKPE